MLSNPLAATIGPDLRLVATSFGTNYDITPGRRQTLACPSKSARLSTSCMSHP
jgi:hypothetical protein